MTSQDEDRVLVRHMLAGDEAAFERFSEAYIPALLRFALQRLDGDRDLARELTQSTVCKAIEKLETFRGEAALMTWLCACCRNEIAMHFRKQGRLRPLEEAERAVRDAPGRAPQTGPEGAVLRKESAELVHLVLDQLPGHYGKALEWKYFHNLPVKEIAERLDLGTKAAESLLTRARVAFKQGYRHLVASANLGAQAPAQMGKLATVTPLEQGRQKRRRMEMS